MNAKSFIAAAALFVSAAAAFAAEAPEATASAGTANAATGNSGAGATATASDLGLPAPGARSPTSRDDVKAAAADFLKHYKTPLTLQLDQYKN